MYASVFFTRGVFHDPLYGDLPFRRGALARGDFFFATGARSTLVVPVVSDTRERTGVIRLVRGLVLLVRRKILQRHQLARWMTVDARRSFGRLSAENILISRLVRVPQHSFALLLSCRPVIFAVVEFLGVFERGREAGGVKRARDRWPFGFVGLLSIFFGDVGRREVVLSLFLSGLFRLVLIRLVQGGSVV